MRKLPNPWRITRFILSSAMQLKNWYELLSGSLRERCGKEIQESPMLYFRNGLMLCAMKGTYSGYTILFHEIFVNRCYQPTSLFKIFDGQTVVDIGANMGFFSCMAAKQTKKGRVIAVEPVSYYVERLKENIKLNKLTNIAILPYAASGKSGSQITVRLWFTKSGEPKTGLVYPESENPQHIEHETVKGFTLEENFNH